MITDDEIRKTVEMAIPLDNKCKINRDRQLKERVWLFNKIKDYIDRAKNAVINNDTL